MSFVSAFVMYNCFWWLTLFAVLPTRYAQQQSPEPGCDPSAPEHSHIGRKLIHTTIIATLLWAVATAVILSEIIDLDSLPFDQVVTKR